MWREATAELFVDVDGKTLVMWRKGRDGDTFFDQFPFRFMATNQYRRNEVRQTIKEVDPYLKVSRGCTRSIGHWGGKCSQDKCYNCWTKWGLKPPIVTSAAKTVPDDGDANAPPGDCPVRKAMQSEAARCRAVYVILVYRSSTILFVKVVLWHVYVVLLSF